VFSKFAVVVLCLTALSCSRQPSSAGFQRIAILRFENVGTDPSLDWMGRAFALAIARDLAAAPGVYAIPFERLHRLDQAFGPRPLAAPGISAEQSLALSASANQLAYGEYYLAGGKLEARLAIEDPQSQKILRVLSASANAGDVAGAADSLARQISNQAVGYPTRSPAALTAYSAALESTDPAARIAHLEEAIAADSGFALPYYSLAQAKLQQQDRAGAVALLDQALAQGSRIPELERARLAYLAAGIRGDAASSLLALTAWSHAAPTDPDVWSLIGQDFMNSHRYAESMQAFQKVLAVDPDDINALNRLGYAAAYAGQLDPAMTAFQHYQALRPGDANPLDSMGDVHLVLGRLHDAENFYLQAARRDPSFLNGGELFKAAMARLMSGDVAGADGLAKQYADGRAAARDVMADSYRAQWSWIAGRRQEGVAQMTAFALNAEKNSLHHPASQAYSQLAIWNLAQGDRSGAARQAEKAVALAEPASANLAAAARFLSQPAASEAEWAARAQHDFTQPAQKPTRDLLLSYALLAEQQFAAAARILEPMYEHTANSADESLPVLLAWAWLESGKPKEAAGLLRFNPIPPATGVRPLSVFDFPRLFYLRGRVAALAGNPQQAQSYYALFLKLSGNEPLMWAEEAKAK
jgi:Flp pilus assembly protein TadD